MTGVSSNSREAYHELKESGRLNEEQLYVHEQLKVHGPCTGKELYQAVMQDRVVSMLQNFQQNTDTDDVHSLAERYVDRLGLTDGPERVRKRLPELADQLGLAMRLDTRTCDVSGREATVWAAVPTTDM